MGTENFYSTPRWREIRQLVLKRDGFRCRDCNRMCESPDADVHHLIPRSIGGKDEPGNLITLCDGCHAAHHPNLQATLSRRFIERWACRLAKWLDGGRLLSDGFDWLGSILRLFAIRCLGRPTGPLHSIHQSNGVGQIIVLSGTGTSTGWHNIRY